MFYYEYRNIFGSTSCAKASELPPTTAADGRKTKITHSIELKPEDYDKTLVELNSLYGTGQLVAKGQQQQ